VRAAGGEAQLFEIDLADAQAIAATARSSSLAYGAPYCIVNNASIFPRASLLDMTIDTFDTTLKVNVTAPFQIIQAFGPQMIERGRGVILNVASGRALEGAVNGASYACSKAAILSLTKTVSLEWAKHNIRCNCIIPGVSLTAQPLAATTEEELLERGKTRIPLGRVAYPEDVAGLAAWLVSSDAAYMTGQGVAMNGGAVLIPQ
jgi:NAD(P)-dependent dehydrogenase (short-subunit alcohol dehydrogenase family)